jgi:hypothetical protein
MNVFGTMFCLKFDYCRWGNFCSDFNFAIFSVMDFFAKEKQLLSFYKCSTIRFKLS